MNYFPFHIGDYAVHTRHLSLMEDLAYRRMIDLYYTRECALPAEPAQVARLIGMRDNVDEVTAVLGEFFAADPESGDWIHSRCEAEITRANEAAERARNNGKRGGRPVGSHKEPTANPEKTQPVIAGNPEETKSQAPNTQDQDPIPKEEKGKRKRSPSFDSENIELPSWLDRELWVSWSQERRKRGKALTEAGVKQQLAQLAEYRQNGHSPERVIGHAIGSGNQGLFPPPVIRRGFESAPARPVEVWKPPPPLTAEEMAASRKARDIALGAVKLINKASE